MKNIERYALIPGMIGAASLIFFIIPGSVLLFSFSGVAFLKGEIWRLFTFPFTHSGLTHFIENMGALTVTAILGYVVNLDRREFLYTFLGASMLIAFADIVLFPTLVIAGASLGIFAVLGTVGVKGTDFMPRYVFLPVLVSPVFYKFIAASFTGNVATSLLSQTLLHFFGFVAGILIFYILGTWTNKRVLTRG